MAGATRAAAGRRTSTMGVRNRRRVSLALKLVIMGVAILYALFPVAFVLSAALDPLNTLVGVGIFPQRVTLDNFVGLFHTPLQPWPRWIMNSAIVAASTAVIVTSLTALAAYAFSRLRFRGRRAGLLAVVVVQLFPNMLAIVALFLLLQSIGNVVPALGLDSLGGLILIYSGGALGFNTWLMKGYFDTVPFDLDESAMVDGATHLQAFRRIAAAGAADPGRHRHPHLHRRLLGLPPRPDRPQQHRELHPGGGHDAIPTRVQPAVGHVRGSRADRRAAIVMCSSSSSGSSWAASPRAE